MLISAFCSLNLCLAVPDQGPPPSPGESDWRFVDALAAPMTWHPHWTRTTKTGCEVSLKEGVQVEAGFPDVDDVLEAAYEDLGNFFTAVGVPTGGPFRIITERVPTPEFET
ncbi:MAG: hypothetical protein GY851_01325, partial [bacterium]|nr:hypothetical protein [bacterium]